jgi:hypothetical protein
MVDAFLLEYLAKTLAALPVGASKTERFPTEGSDLTSADISVVFPVPAYPFNKKILLLPIVEINSLKFKSTFFCSFVGLWEKCFKSFSIKF